MAGWDRGEQPSSAHVHHDHDETIVIPIGSGTVLHGPDPEHVTATRFQGPIALVAPAGAYHHVVMDPDVTARGTCFFTVPGTVLIPFADREPLNRFGKVTFADMRVVEPPPVQATVPFRGPCVIVMPAGAFHRIVRTDDARVDSILIYTDRRAVVERYERITERTTFIPVGDGTGEGDSR